LTKIGVSFFCFIQNIKTPSFSGLSIERRRLKSKMVIRSIIQNEQEMEKEEKKMEKEEKKMEKEEKKMEKDEKEMEKDEQRNGKR